MGAIVNQEMHEKDTQELQSLAAILPAYTRHLSHHLRNSLSSIIMACELAQQNAKEGHYEALTNDLARIASASEHMERDLKEAGL